MSDLVRQILAELPNRAERSSLEPYQELIQEIRRRGYSYREISRLLEERCSVKISHAAIHNFVRRRRQMPGAEPLPNRSQGAGRSRVERTPEAPAWISATYAIESPHSNDALSLLLQRKRWNSASILISRSDWRTNSPNHRV